MRAKRLGPEVLVAEDAFVHLKAADVAALTAEAPSNDRARIRFCAHRTADDALHEMFIVHQKGTYVRPHKHLNKSESAHILEGNATFVVFDEAGNVRHAVKMGDVRSGLDFYYRMSEPSYHTLLIHSDWLVFHEVTTGPFVRADTVFAPWSPEPDDVAGQRAFMARIEGVAEARRRESR